MATGAPPVSRAPAWLARVALATAPLAAALLAAAVSAAGCHREALGQLPRAPREPFHRGVALGLYSEDPAYSYDADLEEIRGHGASHVSLIFSWYQEDVEGTVIAPSRITSPSDIALRKVIRAARARGLKVTLSPLLGLIRRKPEHWRGNIRPRNLDAWWESYRRFIVRFATLCAQERCAALSVGSELVSREGDRAQWEALVREVRAVFPGQVFYSANFDHFREIPFWRSLDFIGVSAYYRLDNVRAGAGRPVRRTVAELVAAWAPIRGELAELAERTGRKLLLTEVGYASQPGAAGEPWNDKGKGPVDLEGQRRLYEAFVRAWAGEPALAGVYFWVWYNRGGAADRSYTPRWKPAALVLRAFYRDATLWPPFRPPSYR